MTTSLLRLPEVERRVGISAREIYKRMKSGVFPQSVKIGERGKAWVEAEIEQYIKERIAERDAAKV